MNPVFLLTCALALVASAAPPKSTERVQRTWGSLTFTPCTLSTSQSPQTTDALCTTLEVPLDRAKPEGAKVSLALAWVQSKAYEAAPDPVFLLAGGPGQSAKESYPGLAHAFADTLKKRNVVLVDQRGTGGSHRLTCPGREEESWGDGPEAAARFTRACAAAVTDTDVRFYSTSEAVDDLDAVRAALGAAQVDLLGISYGTRVAQQYARRYPAHTRALVLDGVVPNSLVLGAEHARNLERSLSLQLARCTADPTCHERFGDVRAELDALLEKLAKAPMPVDYRDPITGVRKHEDFTRGHLAGVVRMFAYAPAVATVLPVAIHEAAKGNAEILMAQSKLINAVVGESITVAMHWSVVCTEDADELKADPADAKTALGTELVDTLVAQCREWPHHARALDFREPLSSEVPVLLLSGEFDPVTPPHYADQVLGHLKRGRHLVAKGQGHNVFPVGCLPRLVKDFFEKPDPAALDAKCLDTLTYAAPFTSLTGSEP